MYCNTSYKKTSAEEICSFKLENSSLREEVANLKKVGQDNLQLLQEVEYTKNKANEEYARYYKDRLDLKLKNAK